jgi:hypothetical protein
MDEGVEEDDLGGGSGFGVGVVSGPRFTQRAAGLVLGGARIEDVGQTTGERRRAPRTGSRQRLSTPERTSARRR